MGERRVCGLSTRPYRRAVETVLDGYGMARSSVSRHFVRATAGERRERAERRLEKLERVARLIEGIEFAGPVMGVALGLDESGVKHLLGLGQGATENATVVRALLEGRVERGLEVKRRYRFVLDGSKALRAAVQRVFGHPAEVQRCLWHKIGNLIDHLPENCRTDGRG